MQLLLDDVLASQEGLSAQIQKFIDQVYYTQKYSIFQKRQSDMLRFMPFIQDMQVLSPTYTYYSRQYVKLTDQLVQVPSDGGVVHISGLDLPDTVGILSQQDEDQVSVIYCGVSSAQSYSFSVQLPSKQPVSRMYIQDKLGVLNICNVQVNGVNFEPTQQDMVWVVDFAGDWIDKITVYVKQHIMNPYMLDSILEQIMSRSSMPNFTTKTTGIPVIAQLDIQLCFGSTYDGVQVYKTPSGYDIVLGLQEYEFQTDALYAYDHVISEPIILAR